MDANQPYYGTEGGGTAVMVEDQLVWVKPPKELTTANAGDPVPREWGIVGPFGDTTNELLSY